MKRWDFCLFTATAATAQTVLRADHVLTGGRFYAGPELRPFEAIALAGDRVFAYGTRAEILALAGANTKKTDLGGATVLPGFIDSHTHVSGAGLRHLTQVECDLTSIAAIVAAIRTRAGKTAPGKWIYGFKYDDTKTAEGRKLTKEDLDGATTQHPVAIRHRGGHTLYVNSLAFQMGDVNPKTPDPPGGMIVKDLKGGLTGELRETAATLVAGKRGVVTDGQRREGVKRMTAVFARSGITSVHDALGTPDDLQSYQECYRNGELSCRVYALQEHRYIDDLIKAGIRTGLGDEWVRVGAMKMIADGSISERTARLSEPYAGRPDDYGIMVMPEEELYATGLKAHKAGWRIGTHANGDVGIDVALRVYERLQKEHPRKDPRFRIEHCTLINEALLDRIKALDAIPTPFWTYVYYHGEKMREYGVERLSRMFAMRSFLDKGIRVAPGSDYVPGPFEPLMALQSCVTRTDSNGNVWGGNQKISVREAILASTQNGAYASGEEHSKGSLDIGKLADLVVLDRDPHSVNPNEIIRIKVLRTMAGGRWTFES